MKMDRVHGERDEVGREGYISLVQSSVFNERPIVEFKFKNIFTSGLDRSVVYYNVVVVCCIPLPG